MAVAGAASTQSHRFVLTIRPKFRSYNYPLTPGQSRTYEHFTQLLESMLTNCFHFYTTLVNQLALRCEEAQLAPAVVWTEVRISNRRIEASRLSLFILQEL